MRTWNQPKSTPRSGEQEANTLHKILSESQATKKCKLKNGGILLWTYLVPVAIVSLLLCWCGFRVITGLGSHAAILMARHPLFCYSLFIGSAIIFLASGISILFYFKKRDTWVDWAICISFALTLIFVTGTALQVIRGLSIVFWDYPFFMINVSMAFFAFFIKYKANVVAARESVVKGESIESVWAVNPKIAKILFSIAVYALCAEIGIACVLLVLQEGVVITGSIPVGIVMLVVIVLIGRNNYKEEPAE